MFREPPFYQLSPPVKILALIMVMVITFLVVLAFGVALSIPIFGRGMLDNIAIFSDYSNPSIVFALKYFQIAGLLLGDAWRFGAVHLGAD